MVEGGKGTCKPCLKGNRKRERNIEQACIGCFFFVIVLSIMIITTQEGAVDCQFHSEVVHLIGVFPFIIAIHVGD